VKEVLKLACFDSYSPSSYALVWEDKVLQQLPTQMEYSWLMSILHLFSFGRPYYKEYIKPEAIPLCKNNTEFIEVIDNFGYKFEDIFSCYGVFAVNLATIAESFTSVKRFFGNFYLKNVYFFDWGYSNSLIILNKWNEVFNDPVKVLVNYRYTLNLYERNTSIKLKKRERDYTKVYNTWSDRYCSMNLQDRLKTIKVNQFTFQTATMQ